MAEGLTAQ